MTTGHSSAGFVWSGDGRWGLLELRGWMDRFLDRMYDQLEFVSALNQHLMRIILRGVIGFAFRYIAG